MDKINEFRQRNMQLIQAGATDREMAALTKQWFQKANKFEYSYHFEWLGRPVIQYPQDIVAVQELIWKVKPDLIIETGIAHGGSLILSASLLALLDYCEAAEAGCLLDPRKPSRRVLGIDIDIREHNRVALESHPLFHRIQMIQGSSVDPQIVAQTKELAQDAKKILIFLDSNHTHDHVLAELEAYAPLTSPGSYCVVFDTVIEDLPADAFSDRPWSHGNNPKTAAREYLRLLETEGRQAADGSTLRFDVDTAIDNKLLITVAPEGFLLRV